MPGTRCTVAVCNNSFEKTKRAGMNILYHKFPKSQPQRDLWIQKCRRAGKWNPDSCHVCSIHFTDDDYRRDMHPNILNLAPMKRRLKSTAVPSLFLIEPPPLEFEEISQRKKFKKSKDDEVSSLMGDNQFVFIKSQDRINDGSPTYEILKLADSNDKNKSSNNKSKPSKISDTEDSECLHRIKKENENIQDNNKKSAASSNSLHLPMKDFGSQTNTDHFLENYQLLIDRNEFLESELVKWQERCRNLISNVKHLESTIERLSLDSENL